MLVAAGGLGTVLGSLAARGSTAPQWRRAYMVGLACMAADLLLCAAAPALPVLVLVFVLGGFGNGFALVHDRLLLGAAVPDALHGRVFALQKALTSFAFAGSFAGASVLIAATDVQHTFLVAGVLMLGGRGVRGPAAAGGVAGGVGGRFGVRGGARGRVGDDGVGPLPSARHGEIAQLVEHTTENRGVPGSSPGLATREPAYLRDLLLLGPRR